MSLLQEWRDYPPSLRFCACDKVTQANKQSNKIKRRCIRLLNLCFVYIILTHAIHI